MVMVQETEATGPSIDDVCDHELINLLRQIIRNEVKIAILENDARVVCTHVRFEDEIKRLNKETEEIVVRLLAIKGGP